MRVEELRLSIGRETLAATRILAGDESPGVVSFHGTGTAAHRGRVRYVLEHLAAGGVSSACFDFSGHGESSGTFETATLRQRIEEADAAARILCPPRPRAIIGASMGAHLAAVLRPRLQPRALILFCPAAYPAQALDCTMSALPRPGAYDDSPAFAALGGFDGTLLIVAGANDTVVSPDVVTRYASSAPAAKTNVIELEECGHAIHAWLADHDRDRALVLNGIAAAIS